MYMVHYYTCATCMHIICMYIHASHVLYYTYDMHTHYVYTWYMYMHTCRARLTFVKYTHTYKQRRLEELRGAFFSTFPHPP